MSENDPGASAVKERLLSLYRSSPPQLFTQVLVDYDLERQRVTVESARVHDLRAGARLQILFADGFKKEAAIRFLREAIQHLEREGLPPAGDAATLPDGSVTPGPDDDVGQDVGPRADGPPSWETLLTTIRRQPGRGDSPDMTRREATASPAQPHQAPEAQTRGKESHSSFPTPEGHPSPQEGSGVGERVRRLLPALISEFNSF